MGQWDQEQEHEQDRVHSVIKKVKARMQELEEQLGGVKSDVVNMRTDFWGDVTVNFDTSDDAVETHASMKQQTELLSERERSFRHANQQLSIFKRLRHSPYFGRIDFVEAGDEETEHIYLGVGSFFDERTNRFLVYDWRAPISSLYYDYSPGAVQYEAPDGAVTGEMTLKRQFVIRNGHIRSMFDTGVTVGDAVLQEVLGKHGGGQMKSIVATIQKEQNRIIRNEKARLLIVQGAAGSGKTSAALQRAAYLLYRYRDTLRADQIVLFSPNPLFNSYVSTVLPELGEENVQQTTFQDYLERQLEETFQLEDPFIQMEYALTASEEPGYDVRMDGIRYKASTSFMQFIERYAEGLKREGMMFRGILLRDEVLISAETIHSLFYSLDVSISIPNRMQLLVEELLKQLEDAERRERKKRWVEEEVELLDQDTYTRVHQKLQKKKRYSENTFDDAGREQKLLAAFVVKKHFKPLREFVKGFGFIDMPALYKQLFTLQHEEEPGRWKEICAATMLKIDRTELAYEDATPYLYLKEQIEGFGRNVTVRHVFIDEGQDYSPFQFAFLKRLFPNSKMTVLGDSNQSIHAHTIDHGFSMLRSLYGEERTEEIVLTKSYRSTKPIIEFTRQLIPGGGAVEAFHREGNKPVMIRVKASERIASITERIHRFQQEGHETIAVICRTAQESEEAYEMLKQQMPLRLIRKESSSFEAGVLIIPSYLAKGMEFDAVIVYDGSLYKEESERRLFYTVCTRAMHELCICCSVELNPFLTGALSDTYIVE